jgi:hypothetical protein
MKIIASSEAIAVRLQKFCIVTCPESMKFPAWLARHPRWIFHFTPTLASWLNAVEGFFAKLTRRRLQRGVFRSLVELQTAINRYLADHNASTNAPFADLIGTGVPGGSYRDGRGPPQVVCGNDRGSHRRMKVQLSDWGADSMRGRPEGNLDASHGTTDVAAGPCGPNQGDLASAGGTSTLA